MIALPHYRTAALTPLIALFCNSFPPEGGGASGRMYHLAVMLRDAGYRVQVVCAMPNYPTGKIFPAYRGKRVVDEALDGIAVKRVWLIPSNAALVAKRGASALSFVLSLRRYAYKTIAAMNPVLVIVSSPPLPMAADAVRYFAKRGAKVLLNVSDIWPLSGAMLGAVHGGPFYKALQRMEQKMYARAAAFAAQSEDSIAHIRHIDSTAKSALVYRNLPQDALQAQHPIPPRDVVRIVYPGMLGHAQGMLALCKAIRFPALNAELHIYGEGPEQWALQEWIAANAECGVHYHAPLPGTQLAKELAQYHAMLVPLVAPIEGALPSKIFTAIRAGIPVIYSGGGEGARLVQEYELGWNTAPLYYEGIAGLIRALGQRSTEELKAKQAHLLHIGKTAFSKSVQDKALLHFIETLIG